MTLYSWYRFPITTLTGVLLAAAVSQAASPAGLLKDLRQRYRQVRTLKAHFKEVFQWELTGETVVREGSLAVAAENRFRIDTPDQLVVSDGQVISRFNKARNQVIIEAAVESGAGMLPNRLLLDFADQFRATGAEELAVSEKPGFRLELTAEDPEALLLKEAVVWATAGDLTIHRLKLTDLNGNTTTYQLSEIELNQPLDSSLTIFTPPPGAEVFDLR